MKLQYINLAITAAIKAGEKIMPVYNSNDFEVELKKDKSPLTRADKLSHAIISDILGKEDLPILSEEGREIGYPERKKWKRFWLIDPIDGTKEFINRNGEFTVNIALIENEKAIAGIIYAPVLQELYVGVMEMGAYKIYTNNPQINFSQIKEQGVKLPATNNKNDYVIVASRSFLNNETKQFISELKKEHPNATTLSRGSSLKICMVAEGKAKIYPRFGPTMEWDTAAGHAIAKAAGKNIYFTEGDDELCYNKENLLNPYFIVK